MTPAWSDGHNGGVVRNGLAPTRMALSPVERAAPRLRIRSMRVRSVEVGLLRAPGARGGVLETWRGQLPVRGCCRSVGGGVEIADGDDGAASSGSGEELGRLCLLDVGKVLSLEVGRGEPEAVPVQPGVDAGPTTVEGERADRRAEYLLGLVVPAARIVPAEPARVIVDQDHVAVVQLHGARDRRSGLYTAWHGQGHRPDRGVVGDGCHGVVQSAGAQRGLQDREEVIAGRPVRACVVVQFVTSCSPTRSGWLASISSAIASARAGKSVYWTVL